MLMSTVVFRKTINLLFILLTFNHLFACLWFFIASYDDFQDDTWVILFFLYLYLRFKDCKKKIIQKNPYI
jgi:hypothetical protein